MGPSLSQLKGKANVGFLTEQKPEEEAGQSRAPPLPTSISFHQNCVWGRGQNNYWSLNLAPSFYSTFPRINYPKTSPISKKGNC